MKKRKNLERAIVLGLMLSTSISCNVVFADKIENNHLTTETDVDFKSENDNLIIKGGENGYKGTISVGEGYTLTIDSGSNAIHGDFGAFDITADNIYITAGANGIFTGLDGSPGDPGRVTN